MCVLSELAGVEMAKSALKSAILPRPKARSAEIDPGEPLVIAGMFGTANGIGRAARACLDAFRAEGLDPYAIDLSGLFNQSDTVADLELRSMPRSRTGTLILFANAPETERALIGLGLRRWHNWRIIGCWAWELPVAPEGWVSAARHLSEIWTPSQFVQDCFDGEVAIPVKKVPHYVPVRADRRPAKPDNAPLDVLALADGRSSLHRKNLLASVRIFKAAFEDAPGVRLTLKCRNLSEYETYHEEVASLTGGDDRIRLIDQSLARPAFAQLISEADILLSPHRSEGFGLHLAEAMATGLPTIATGWSGNMEFMDAGTAALLPYSLEPVDDPTGVYAACERSRWARPDETAAAEALRTLRDDPDARNALGEAGRNGVAGALTSRAYVDALASA